MYKNRAPFPDAAFVRGQQNLTYFDVDLTSAITDRVISTPGDAFYIDQTSTGFASIEINSLQSGTWAPLLVGAGAFIEADFASLKINASAQPQKTIRIVVANGVRIKGGSVPNASSNNVYTQDGERLATAASKEHIVTASITAVAAQNSYVYIQNAGPLTGRTYIRKIYASSGSANAIILRNANGAIGAGVATPRTKRMNAGTATTYQVNGGNQVGLPGNANIGAIQCLASTPVIFDFKSPIMLTYDQGLVIGCSVVNTDLTVTVETSEE